MTNHVEYLMFGGLLHSFFFEVSSQIIWPFWKLACLILLHCMSSSYILKISPLSDQYHKEYFLQLNGLTFHFLHWDLSEVFISLELINFYCFNFSMFNIFIEMAMTCNKVHISKVSHLINSDTCIPLWKHYHRDRHIRRWQKGSLMRHCDSAVPPLHACCSPSPGNQKPAW